MNSHRPLTPTAGPGGVARNPLAEWGKVGLLALVSLFVLAPVYLMGVISLKDKLQFVQSAFMPTWPLHFENYRTAWQYVGPYIGRTVFVAIVATFLTVALGSLCAFIFAQISFTGKKIIFIYIIVLMMIPGILNLIPMYVLVTRIDQLLRAMNDTLAQALGYDLKLRYLNTLWVLIVPAVAGGQIMMIYVLRTFFAAQPRALFESARIDGAGLVQTYFHIGLPLAKPIVGTMAILNIVALWNDYIWPLVVLQRDHYTVSIGLRYMEGQNYIDYGPLMAGYVMSSIPLVILFIFTMKLFIEGLASGAIKM